MPGRFAELGPMRPTTAPGSGQPLSTAEIIAVGTELLTPFRSDTNSLFLTAGLNELGIVVRRKSIVGDHVEDLAATVQAAFARVDLVVICGGLGPTEDDLTRETVARVLDRTLQEDPAILERLQARFTRRGWTMPDNNRRQARVPSGAVVLANPRGTAPGLWMEHDGRVVVLLPGPPRELEPMFTELVQGRLAARATARRLYRRLLRVAGRGESHRRGAGPTGLRTMATGRAGGRDDGAGVAGAGRAAPVDPGRFGSRPPPRSSTGRRGNWRRRWEITCSVPTAVRCRRSSGRCSRAAAFGRRWGSRAPVDS